MSGPRPTPTVAHLASTIEDQQLAIWSRTGPGVEVTVDLFGFLVTLSDVGKAAFRHRLATDPSAAAKCISWQGPLPGEPRS